MFTNKTKRGFSIGEVMIATFILLVGIIGAIMLTVKSSSNISDGKKAITAALLAQEGTELVRSVRDNSVTQRGDDCNQHRCTAFDADADYGWPNIANGESVCSVDYRLEGDGKLNCSGSTAGEDLYINKDTYFYSHSQGGNHVSNSHFKRKVFIQYETTDGTLPTSADVNKLVAKVTSVVVWTGGKMPNTASSIELNCKINKHCAFAQTRLTSWINY